MPDPDTQQKSRDAIRAHLGSALRRVVEEMGRAEYAALEVQYLMTDRCLALEFNRQLTEALLTSPADDRTAKLAGLASVYLRAPDVARDLRADAVQVHADLTEALFPFGPAAEVPTEPGEYVATDGTIMQACDLHNDGIWSWMTPSGRPHVTSSEYTQFLGRQSTWRFAVRPTPKPPETP